MARRLPPIVPNLLLSLVVTVVFLGGLEGFFRWREHRVRRPPVADYIWDWQQKWDDDFYTIRSDVNGWPPWEEYNADGVRDRSHPVERPDGVRRLVFLGDSVTLGDQILPEEAFPQQLQSRLDERGWPVEVFSVALWGWSTRQERHAYDALVRKYRPDAVVLAVCLNDIPELQNNLVRPPRWLTRLHKESALVRGVVNAQGREIQRVEQMFAEPDAARVREAFTRFFDEVRTLRREVEGDGATFAVIVFPFRFQMGSGAPAPVVQQRIAAFCAAERLRCLDLQPALSGLREAAFVDYDHLNPAGSGAAADALLVSGLVPASTPYPDVLRRVGAPDTVPALEHALQDGGADERAAAAWALGVRGAAAASAVAPLASALGDPDPAVRREAARALGGVGPAARTAREALLRALDDARQPVRWAAARALFDIGVAAEDVPRLAALVRHPDAYVRGFAAFALGNLGPAAKPAVPALAEALALPDAYARAGPAAALAQIGADAAAAVPALVQGLADPDGDRRWKAARTLGRIGPAAREAVPALVRSLSDPNERARAYAARSLARIGVADESVMAALEHAASKDADETARGEARQALRELRRGE